MIFCMLTQAGFAKQSEWVIPFDLIGGYITFMDEDAMNQWFQKNLPSWSEGSEYKKEDIDDPINSAGAVRSMWYTLDGLTSHFNNSKSMVDMATKATWITQITQAKVDVSKGDLSSATQVLLSIYAQVLSGGLLLDNGVLDRIEAMLTSLGVSIPTIPSITP